jgi:hypothetical protein
MISMSNYETDIYLFFLSFLCYAQGNKNKVVYVANLHNFENNKYDKLMLCEM